MSFRASDLIVSGCALFISCGSGAVGRVYAQDIGVPQSVVTQAYPPRELGGYFPTHLVPGETNVVNIATSPLADVQSFQFTPSEGIKVTGMTPHKFTVGGTWWELSVVVAKEAKPGPRRVEAVLKDGRTDAITFMIPAQVPTLSGVKVPNLISNQPTIDLDIAASNAERIFGDSPYVWFVLNCGSAQAVRGVVNGTSAGNAIRVSIPDPRISARPRSPLAMAKSCDLQVRATDLHGTDTKPVKTSFELK